MRLIASIGKGVWWSMLSLYLRCLWGSYWKFETNEIKTDENQGHIHLLFSRIGKLVIDCTCGTGCACSACGTGCATHWTVHTHHPTWMNGKNKKSYRLDQCNMWTMLWICQLLCDFIIIISKKGSEKLTLIARVAFAAWWSWTGLASKIEVHFD